MVVLGGPLQGFGDAISPRRRRRPRAGSPARAPFELLSFGGYIVLLWLVGARASGRLGLRESTQITLGGAAATRLLPTAGVGGAAVTLWALRRSGLGGRGAARTLLTFLVLLYSVFLGSIAVTGTLLTIRGGHPLALTALPAALADGRHAAGAHRLAWLRPEKTGGRIGAAAGRARRPRCATRSATSARSTRDCSARSSGGASTWRCCTGC